MRTSEIIWYHPQNIMICVSGLHMNAKPMSFGFGFRLNWLFAYMGGNLLTVQSLTHTHSNDDIFQNSDKMPTKNWDRQNANHRKSPDKGWHFVLFAFFPVSILSAHPSISDGLVIITMSNVLHWSDIDMYRISRYQKAVMYFAKEVKSHNVVKH